MSPVKHKITKCREAWHVYQVPGILFKYIVRETQSFGRTVYRETPNKDKEQINAEKVEGECLGF